MKGKTNMTMIRKDAHYGWTVTTYIDFRGDLRIKLTTMKRHSGKLVTTASAMRQDGAFESHMVFADFSQNVISETVRVTEKAAVAQHNAALAKRDEIIAAATAHYDAKAEHA